MTKQERIAQLNDLFRKTFAGGRVVVTSGVKALGEKINFAIYKAVQEFDSFTEDNDPYGEHDFGAMEVEGAGKVFWKIDYYDSNLQYGSEDPSDPDQTTRVLTVMLAHEY